MNDNKEIKKLSETGEQSAEIVSGGVLFTDEPMCGCHVMGQCHDCGVTTTNNAYGNYCRGCWLRRKHTGRAPTDEERMELQRQRFEAEKSKEKMRGHFPIDILQKRGD